MHLLPVPGYLSFTDDSFVLGLHTKLVFQDRAQTLAQTAARQLQAEFRSACGLDAEILCGQARPGDICLTVDSALSPQSYTLVIDAQRVTVTGGDGAGLLHGAQTLRQIIRQSGWTLPGLVIEDAPAYPTRGFYHDVTRGRTPTLAFLKSLADEACLYKLNQLQLYMEHTYLFRDMSEMWLSGEPLTASDIMELDDYCASLGIELVPSLSTFGHLLELLRTKSYCELCETPDADQMPSTMPNRMQHLTINATDPRALNLVRGMIDEFMPLFRSRLFNICADETFDLGKGRNKALWDEQGERGLYMGFVKPLCEHVVSRGHTPMFWGDIVLRFSDALSMLPPQTICLNWNYDPNVRENDTQLLHSSGATQYVCPGVQGWNQLMNRLRMSYDNISRMAAYGRKYQAIGMLNTDWGDFGHVNDPRFSLPGMIYGAQFSWSHREISFEDLNESISVLLYQDGSGRAMEYVAAMEDCDLYTWSALVLYKEWKQGTLNREKSPLQTPRTVRHVSVAKANAALAAAADGLRACAPAMDSSCRGMIQCWLITAEGIALWNLVGEAAAQGRKDAKLASQLENWYRLFERMWREVSQDSELWRIRDVVRWYASQVLR